jgi:hypothetical protein
VKPGLGLALAAGAVALFGLAPAGVRQAMAQAPAMTPAAAPATRDDRFAGLQWTFVRIRYTAFTVDNRFQQDYWGEPWAIDAPAAEQNLSRRLRTATAIEVRDPIVLTLEDPKLWDHGWIYMVEPGNLRLKETEVGILREFLLRGGTLTFDDFHGPYEWENMATEMKRVFPTRAIVDLPPSHPIFSVFYALNAYPQIPGLGSFFAGRTWEKGGFTSKLRAILDDNDRPMVLINWNTDMGDGVEWSNAEEYPAYLKFTADAYRMWINEVIYSLTH